MPVVGRCPRLPFPCCLWGVSVCLSLPCTHTHLCVSDCVCQAGFRCPVTLYISNAADRSGVLLLIHCLLSLRSRPRSWPRLDTHRHTDTCTHGHTPGLAGTIKCDWKHYKNLPKVKETAGKQLQMDARCITFTVQAYSRKPQRHKHTATMGHCEQVL